jgi:uncharacterized membrane protein YfcA
MGTLGGALIGLLVGVLSGLVGIGGGALIIPALVFFYGMSQARAQGTSLATLLLPIGFFAFWEYYKAGNADLKLAIFVAAGFAAGGFLGGRWAQHLPEIALRRGFAVLLAGLAIHMFFKR